MFEAYEDNYKMAIGFIYGYLIMALAMWKWTFPSIRIPVEIAEYQPLVMNFVPWKVFGDPSTKEVNAEAFRIWYGQMVDIVMSQQRIPINLLDGYSEQV